jgi:hypothetical protein
MASERVGRFVWLSVLAWMAMMCVIAAWAGVSWYLPGGRDPDISSVVEKVMVFVVVMSVPLALMSAAVLAPAAFVLDGWIGGRLTRPANGLIGAALAIPAAIVYLGVGWLIWGGGGRTFAGWLANIWRQPASTAVLGTAFAIGGVVLSLGVRRRA